MKAVMLLKQSVRILKGARSSFAQGGVLCLPEASFPEQSHQVIENIRQRPRIGQNNPKSGHSRC